MENTARKRPVDSSEDSEGVLVAAISGGMFQSGTSTRNFDWKPNWPIYSEPRGSSIVCLSTGIKTNSQEMFAYHSFVRLRAALQTGQCDI